MQVAQSRIHISNTLFKSLPSLEVMIVDADPLPLPTEDMMDLLNLCLISTYFQYNGKHYKQLHGTAMGSPVSVVVAKIVMQRKAPFRLADRRYHFGYATLTILSPPYDTTKSTHSTTTSTKKTLTYREVEENGKLPFLDCLVSRDDNSLRTTVYRKTTHTDRLLDESSFNPTSHKAITIRTLTRRAQLICNSTDSLSDENNCLDGVFSKNNYNEDFIQRNTYRPTTTTEANDNATLTTTATITYIKGISENISHILSTSIQYARHSQTYYLTTSVTD